ncbi:AAA family ATPase [Desulfurivibrio alkaliphilus]|uniref:Response regulator receiver protein n=1 Tax=Desulfurivibrio alkaliphilus (strain DSM 19089 / UNIQEM U267 / AHT2) TaxID=589865 RepID=D6Z1Q2_DESAT|nr:response regulator receiver protein [Desulfurivibrio alkaliphilus]ADH85477.1 response regulator receiver protein [Desulfurivibrio alkaliphilus AHT 2]
MQNTDHGNVIAVCNRQEHVQWLIDALDDERDVVLADHDSVERIGLLVDAAKATVIFVQLEEGEIHSHTSLIEGLLALKPGLSVVAISTDVDQTLLLAAMRAGARDYLRVGSDPREVVNLVHHLEETTPARQAATPESSRTYSFISARPYEGVTTLAVHCALAMLTRPPGDGRVLLLDLGLPPGDTQLALGLQPTYSFLDAIRSVRRFDQTLIQTAFIRHDSGLTTLALPEDLKGMAEVTAADVMILLNVLRSYFSRIVVHLGGVEPTDFVRLILAKSDLALLMVEQSLPHCRSSQQLLAKLANHDYPVNSMGMVVDRYSPDVGLSASDISEALELTLFHRLPPSGLVRMQALNSGQSIFELAPRNGYAKAVHEFTDKLIGCSDHRNGLSPRRNWPSWLGRLFG